MVHAGSWFGLPDFGITEAIQKKYSPQSYTTAQGGSNISGLFSGQAYTPASQGQVLGTGTEKLYTPMNQSFTTISPQPQQQQQQTGGGDTRLDQLGKMGARNPIQEQEYQQLLQQSQTPANNYLAEYNKQLDNLAGLIPGREKGFRDLVSSQYESGLGSIETGQAESMANVDKSRTAAEERKSVTLKDMADDMRNALQSAQVYLGNIGAGDSSAAGRMGGALAKAGNKRRTDVMNQFNTVMGDLDSKENEIKRVAEQEVRELNTWKSSQLNNIAQWVADQQSQIQGMRTEDARNMWMSAQQEAMNRLSQIDQQAAQFGAALQEWALSRSNSIGELRNNLSQLSQYQLPQFSYSAFGGSSAPVTSNSLFGQSTIQDEDELV